LCFKFDNKLIIISLRCRIYVCLFCLWKGRGSNEKK